MKPMIYKATREIEILDEGVINNFHYCIVSHGTHPCAYIELPETHEYYGLDYDAINIVCHGGLTYASDKKALYLTVAIIIVMGFGLAGIMLITKIIQRFFLI